MNSPIIRRATADDRPHLVAMLDASFATRNFSESFAERFPHLFTDEAISEHLLAVDHGQILSCVGCYDFAASLHGAPLRACGIGQVATLPAARRGGLMSRLLAVALGAVPDCDLFWLYGQRQRYARVGFAPGGAVISGMTEEPLVREAVGACVPVAMRELDLQQDAALIARTLAARPFALALNPAQQLTMLCGKRVRGLTDGEACILLDGSGGVVWSMSGPTLRVVHLIARHLHARTLAQPGSASLTLQADPDDRDALVVIRMLASEVRTSPTASLRVGRLLPLLQAWAASHPPPPEASLRPWTIDGGAAGCVRIASEGRQWRITAASTPGDLRLEGSALAELVFGFVPLRAWNLASDLAVRYLLPLQFAIPKGYEL